MNLLIQRPSDRRPARCPVELAMAVALLCGACGADSEYAGVNPGAPGECLDHGIWVQDDPDLSPALASDGCHFFGPEGVCCPTAARDDADVRIYSNPQPCPLTPGADAYVLAVAFKQGTIVVNTQCLDRPYGSSPSAEQFRNIIAHEVGHVLGMWFHIPRDCDSEDPSLPVRIHPSGAPICGPAIMNPLLDVSLNGPTGPDLLAFDLRDPSGSGSRAGGSGAAGSPAGDGAANALTGADEPACRLLGALEPRSGDP